MPHWRIEDVWREEQRKKSPTPEEQIRIRNIRRLRQKAYNSARETLLSLQYAGTHFEITEKEVNITIYDEDNVKETFKFPRTEE